VIIRKYTHEAIVHNFFQARGKERKIYQRGKNIFYIEDRLYSFGEHHIIAVKCRNGIIINSRYYSRDTTRHTHLAERHARSKYTNVAIINFDLIEDSIDSNFEWLIIKDICGEFTIVAYGRNKYLCGIDTTCKNWYKNSFIAKIPYGILTISGAQTHLNRWKNQTGVKKISNAILKPCLKIETKHLTSKAKEVMVPLPGVQTVVPVNESNIKVLQNFVDYDTLDVRGHEAVDVTTGTDVFWQDKKPYFVMFDKKHSGMRIPYSAVYMNSTLKIATKIQKQGMVTGAHATESNAPQVFKATEMIKINKGGIYVRGTVRCRNHTMARLGKTWHKLEFWDSKYIKFEI